jgi:hypothetical protein
MPEGSAVRRVVEEAWDAVLGGAGLAGETIGSTGGGPRRDPKAWIERLVQPGPPGGHSGRAPLRLGLEPPKRPEAAGVGCFYLQLLDVRDTGHPRLLAELR